MRTAWPDGTVAVINFFGGHHGDDPRGRAKWWRENPREGLLERAQKIHDAGIRRVNLRLVGGSDPDQLMDSRQLEYLDGRQSQALAEFTATCRRRDISVSAFFGWRLREMWDTMAHAHPPEDWYEHLQLLKPWVHRYGVREFWLDHSTPDLVLLVERAEQFDRLPDSITIVGEGVPDEVGAIESDTSFFQMAKNPKTQATNAPWRDPAWRTPGDGKWIYMGVVDQQDLELCERTGCTPALFPPMWESAAAVPLPPATS